ncbi:MAG: hypothetical protein RL518_2722 [Pseudomonadota bacterium]|jgi:hypothetical protein
MRSTVYKLAWFGAVVALGGWSLLVLLYSPALPSSMRVPLAVLVGALLLSSFLTWRHRRKLRIATLVIFATVGGLWTSLNPSHDRSWTPDVARAPWGEIRGDEVIVHNVRNFSYRTDEDYDVRYEDRTVRLSELSEVDILVTYWGSKPIAHIMVSFGFGTGQFLAVSIETRKEQGESYSAVNGFFRNYELAYVVADERDVVALRTNYRNPQEQVYVLRTQIALENGRKLFLDYINSMNNLRERPQFYNTLTTNCTTQVLRHVWAFGSEARYNWQILLSGYVPEYLYENDVLMPGMKFEDIMSASLVNERAHVVPRDDNFSRAIREGVPRPPARGRSEGQ